MTFTPSDPITLATFVLILNVVLAAIFFAVHRATTKSMRINCAILAWLVLIALIVQMGVVAEQPFPRLMVFMLLINLVGAAFALSPIGKSISLAIPLAALVGFQAFRLPLELVLHSWTNQGVIPESMTWTGSNFDILSGIVALIAAPFANRSRAIAWLANIVGFGLLINVGRVAIMSSPLPFAWPVSPPLQLGFHLPYAFIVPVCVSGALAGHIVLTRALLKR